MAAASEGRAYLSRIVRRTGLVIFSFGWGATAIMAQPAPHTPYKLRREVPLVNLTLVATDAQGHPYLALRRPQIEVLENGQPQKLIYFQPAWQASAGTKILEAGSVFHQEDARGKRARRSIHFVALAVDELTLTPLQRTRLIASLRGLFAATMPQPTVYAVFAMRHGLKLVQTFTDDPAQLQAAVARLAKDRLGISRHQTVDNLLQDLNDCRCLTGNAETNAGIRGSAPTGTLFNLSGSTHNHLAEAHRCGFGIAHSFRSQQEQISRQQMSNLRELVNLLGILPGAKQLIYLGNGFLLNPGDLAYQAYSSYFDPQPMYAGELEHRLSLREVAAAAQANDVSIDAFDLRRLQADSLAGNLSGNFGHSGSGMSHPPGDTGPQQGPAVALNFLLTREQASLNSLRLLADTTGGRAFLRRNQIEPSLLHAVEDLQGTYYAAYAPLNRKLDGSYRRISLKVLGNGIKVRTRTGYFARAWKRLPLKYQVETGLQAGHKITALRCRLPARVLSWRKRGVQRYSQLVAYQRVVNQRGQTIVRQFYAWPVQPDRHGQVRFGFGMSLPPGRYYCLISLQEPGGRRIGEIDTPIQVK